MRIFLAFLGLFGVGFGAVAVLAYPIWTWAYPLFGFPFHRFASRVGMVFLLLGFVLLARRMALADRTSLGYGLPRREFLREAGLGLALGVATMLPVVLAMVVFDMRNLREGVTLSAQTWATLALKGALSGLAVALIEETFMRGAMFTGIARESSARVAILLTSLLYAVAHFLGKYRIPPEQVGPGSGIEMIGGWLQALGNPSNIVDAFLSLFLVGVLLGMVRARTGNIAACLGLHAGWVWVITFVRETSERDPASPAAFLLSNFDGVVGWMVFGWTIVIGVVLTRFYESRRGPSADGSSRSISPSR